MRATIDFDCLGTALKGTLDDAPSQTGLFVVSGGNEIRMGAHRGMAKLASDIAGTGHPVFRFDRRGIGDSDGGNEGFLSSRPDLEAALSAFKSACPKVKKIVAFGNCDAASAILLHNIDGIDAAVLANIWVIEETGDLPPPAAIKARYAARLRDPKAWLGLFTGAINLRKLASGLMQLTVPRAPSALPLRVAAGLIDFPGPVTILLATGDATALAFQEVWGSAQFAEARVRPQLTVQKLETASHSFASESDYLALKSALLKMLDNCSEQA